MFSATNAHLSSVNMVRAHVKQFRLLGLLANRYVYIWRPAASTYDCVSRDQLNTVKIPGLWSRCGLFAGFYGNHFSTQHTGQPYHRHWAICTSHANHKHQCKILHCLIQRRISLQHFFPPNHASALTEQLNNSRSEAEKNKKTFKLK